MRDLLATLPEHKRHPNLLFGVFLLALDGSPLAWTGPHGQSLFWVDQ